MGTPGVAKTMTLSVSGLHDTLANLVGIDKKMKAHIARVCISKGASIIRKGLAAKAQANGYPSLSRAMGIDLRRNRKGNFYAKIGAIARYKITGTRRIGGKVFFGVKARADRYLTSAGGYWTQVVHLMEFGTKPHDIPITINGKRIIIHHPGAKPIPLYRPVWDAHGHAAQQAMEDRVFPEVIRALSGVK